MGRTDRVVAPELSELAAPELLAHVESLHAQKVAAERAIVAAAYQWAVLHTTEAGVKGARPAGAVGTPLITEYAAAAFGARIQTSPYGARRLIADAVDIEQRLGLIASGLATETVTVRHARHVAEATRELTAEQAAWVDAEVVEACDGRLAWSRFEALVEGKVAAAAPALAAEKELAAQLETGVRVSRVNKHGMATLTVRADVATIAGIDAAITAGAETIPDERVGSRRVTALAALVNPAAHLDPAVGPVKPKVKLYLHLHPGTPIARLEGHGPVTTRWVRHLLGDVLGSDHRITVTPVLDLAGHAPVDAYEIPARLREAVRLIHPGDVFPFAASLARTGDLDHAEPWGEGGPTAVGNLGPLTRTHHRIKTHGGWESRHPFPGIVVWRDPYGAFYLVDNTGTRRIHVDPPERQSRAEVFVTDFLVTTLTPTAA